MGGVEQINWTGVLTIDRRLASTITSKETGGRGVEKFISNLLVEVVPLMWSLPSLHFLFLYFTGRSFFYSDGD